MGGKKSSGGVYIAKPSPSKVSELVDQEYEAAKWFVGKMGLLREEGKPVHEDFPVEDKPLGVVPGEESTDYIWNYGKDKPIPRREGKAGGGEVLKEDGGQKELGREEYGDVQIAGLGSDIRDWLRSKYEDVRDYGKKVIEETSLPEQKDPLEEISSRIQQAEWWDKLDQDKYRTNILGESSAFGPAQFTYGTLDALAEGMGDDVDPELKKYTKALAKQGRFIRNIQLGRKKNPDVKVYGYKGRGGKGSIPDAEHEKYYNKLIIRHLKSELKNRGLEPTPENVVDIWLGSDVTQKERDLYLKRYKEDLPPKR